MTRSLPTRCLLGDESDRYCPRGCYARCFIQDMDGGSAFPIVPEDAERTELPE